MDEETKAEVRKWTYHQERLEARAYKDLAADPKRFWKRFEILKAEGDAILEADDIPIPPYILIAIRDNDERTLKSFFNRRGADQRLTIKVKEYIKEIKE